MAKKGFSLGAFGNAIAERSLDTGLLIGGMATSRKFLDFGALIKKPDNPIVKNQGIIKFLLGLGLAGTMENVFVKNLAMGMAIEGGFTALRKLTAKKVGDSTEYFIEQIGREDLDDVSSVAGEDNGLDMPVAGLGQDDDEIELI